MSKMLRRNIDNINDKKKKRAQSKRKDAKTACGFFFLQSSRINAKANEEYSLIIYHMVSFVFLKELIVLHASSHSWSGTESI